MAIGTFLGKFGQNEAVLNLIDNADDVTKRRLIDVAVHLKDKNKVIESLSEAPQLLQELLNKVGEGIDSAKAFIDDLEILLNSEGMSLEILLRLLSDLNMSVADLKDWIAKLGVNRVIELSEKYGADAMKFYGADWFAAFKGVTNNLRKHLVDGDGITGSSASGYHDKGTFLDLEASGQITTRIVRSDGIYTKYRYYVAGYPPSVERPKTVVDGLGANWSTWENKIKDAIDTLIRNKQFPTADGSSIPKIDIDGIPWQGKYSTNGTKEVSTFYPDLPPTP